MLSTSPPAVVPYAFRAEPIAGYRSTCLKPAECTSSGGAEICRSNADCPMGSRMCLAAGFAGAPGVLTCAK